MGANKIEEIIMEHIKIFNLDEYAKQSIRGNIQDSRIEGRVTVPETTKIINSTIRGPCLIGNGCVIENSLIGPYTSIGNGTKISDSTIEYSVIMDYSQIVGVDRLEESLIGKNAKVTRNHNRNGCLKLHVGDYSEVEI